MAGGANCKAYRPAGERTDEKTNIFADIAKVKHLKDTISMEKPYVLGVDVGGTNTVFGVVDARGNLVISSSIKTGAHNDLNDYIKDLTAGINQLIEQVGGKEKIKGIGVGAPNGNYYTGSIEFAPNLPWKQTQIPFAQMLTDSLGIPTTLTNDANAAAIGEMTYGAARGMKDFIVITLGTGVGSGIVVFIGQLRNRIDDRIDCADGRSRFHAGEFPCRYGYRSLSWQCSHGQA
ncbi:ROK family protein [Porphyromonas gingivalis F0570]|uniref:ROK family protein n=1 Tax=Porphyromonas gingivalis F0570 TaxID=1227271 RepID=A0A0E2LS12_PORGN|nr:ROK family protein [Porphyromonas gingivalis F0570]